MFSFTKKRPESVAEASVASPRELETRLQALELAHDDLHDQFRRFRARVTKRQSLDLEEAAASAPPPNGRPPTIHELKASGRWPLR